MLVLRSRASRFCWLGVFLARVTKIVGWGVCLCLLLYTLKFITIRAVVFKIILHNSLLQTELP